MSTTLSTLECTPYSTGHAACSAAFPDQRLAEARCVHVHCSTPIAKTRSSIACRVQGVASASGPTDIVWHAKQLLTGPARLQLRGVATAESVSKS